MPEILLKFIEGTSASIRTGMLSMEHLHFDKREPYFKNLRQICHKILWKRRVEVGNI